MPAFGRVLRVEVDPDGLLPLRGRSATRAGEAAEVSDGPPAPAPSRWTG
ncbi:MAG: hypothetical protein R3F59_25070 [Myxococcota bacterium]